jgi:hypothetical protein
MKTVYQLDADGFLVGATQADIDPLNLNNWLIPGNCVELAPPSCGNNQIAQYKNGEWFIVADYRGEKYWLPDGSEHEIIVPGEVFPPNALSSPPLVVLKSAKLAQIEQDRNTACYANVNVHGRPWQADPRSQSLIATAILLANIGVPLPASWRDANNNNMNLTNVSQLVQIAGAIAGQTEAAYALSWVRKAALEAATTDEEVNAV